MPRPNRRGGPRWPHVRAVAVVCMLFVVLSGPSMLAGCSAQPRHTAAQDDDRLEAQPLDDDESAADKAGEIGVVGIVVGVIVGGILMPLFLL